MNIKSALIISVAILIIGFTYLYSNRYEYIVMKIGYGYEATDTIIRINKYPFRDTYDSRCIYISGEHISDEPEYVSNYLNMFTCDKIDWR